MKASTVVTWIRWAPLLALTGLLASCGPAVTPEPAGGAAASPDPADPAPTPAAPQATCDDLAIRLLDRSAGIHGAIVADTLHMGGAAAPVTCADPANLALLAHLSIPDDYTAQVQQSQSQYYLIVIRYPGGNRLYVISRRGDGTSCVVDTNDRCIAQVTELPDGFDLDDLPDDVAPTIPAGRPAPEPPAATDTAPAAAGNPQPRDGATGVAVETLLLSWSAADRAASYDVYWGREEHLAADADLGTPIATTFTAATIRRPALGTTYYWRVDAKNDQGTTTGSVWSFTTADRAAPPPAAPGGGYTPPVVGVGAPVWSEAAKQIRLTGYAHTRFRQEIPVPAGFPAPEVSVKGVTTDGGIVRYPEPVADFTSGEDSLTLTVSVGIWVFAEDKSVVLVASNSKGTSELSIPYRFECGYTQQDVINLWVGTHPIVSAGQGERSVRFTSDAMILNGVSHTYLKGRYCYDLGVQGPDGTRRWIDLLGQDTDHLYANLHKGSGTPFCRSNRYDARIGWGDRAFFVRHSSCVPPRG